MLNQWIKNSILYYYRTVIKQRRMKKSQTKPKSQTSRLSVLVWPLSSNPSESIKWVPSQSVLKGETLSENKQQTNKKRQRVIKSTEEESQIPIW